MKILQVIYSLSSGGAERFTVDLCNELSKLGHDVTLCVIRDDKDDSGLSFYKSELNENVKYINLHQTKGFKISTFIKVHLIVNRIKPDVVHCHLNVIPYFFIIGLFNKRIRIVHTLHSIAEKTLHPLQFWINKFFYSKGVIIPVAISDESKKSFENFYQVSKVYKINNGRSFIQPTPFKENVNSEINRLKETNNDFVFIHVARHHLSKNQNLLIEVFNTLSKEKYSFILLIIGQGFENGEGFELQKKADNRIKFLGTRKNVGDYLLCADAFCLTSIYEGLPISLLEALSCGCKPICTPVGGIPNIITDGVTGYLSKDVSFMEYKNAVLRFLNNPIEISKNKLIEHFKNHFSIEECTRHYLEIFEFGKIS